MQTAGGVVAILPMDYVYWGLQLDKLVSIAGPHGETWITAYRDPARHGKSGKPRLESRPNVAGRLGQGPKI